MYVAVKAGSNLPKFRAKHRYCATECIIHDEWCVERRGLAASNEFKRILFCTSSSPSSEKLVRLIQSDMASVSSCRLGLIHDPSPTVFLGTFIVICVSAPILHRRYRERNKYHNLVLGLTFLGAMIIQMICPVDARSFMLSYAPAAINVGLMTSMV